MAEQESNGSPEQDTRKTIFPEAVGKTVESIKLYVTSDHYSINVNFTDNTAMVFPVEPFVAVSPYYGDWATGECKVLKEWKPIRSMSLNE